MEKYIITFEDYPQMKEDGVKFYSCNEAPWWYASEQIISKLTPYTEPDLEQVRQEAYQKGLDDAWECARKVALSEADGGVAWEQKKLVFGKSNYNILKDVSVKDAIKKIQQCDDMKIFKPGNEVVSTLGVGIVTKVTRTGVELFHKDGSTAFDRFESVKKTGRNFPEFVELLKKMEGESNDPD